MKKISKRLSLVATAAVCASFSISAFAVSQTPCYFSDRLLKSKGFTQDAIYTGQSLNELLDKVHVQPAEPFKLDENYRVNYTCVPDHGVGHVLLRADAVKVLHPGEQPADVSVLRNDWHVVAWTFTTN